MPDKTDNPEARKQRFKEIEHEAKVLAEAYRLRLVGRLWWTNLLLVVLPAVCATAAAIFAAGGAGRNKDLSAWAAGLAGVAAVLSAIHKSLKCEEYQAECLRLGSAYEGIAARADSAQAPPEQEDPRLDQLKDLTDRFATLKESAKAPLPDTYISKAEIRTGYKLYRKRVTNADNSPAPERNA